MSLFKHQKDYLFLGESLEVQKHVQNSSEWPYLVLVALEQLMVAGLLLTKLHGTCPFKELVSFLPPVALRGKSTPVQVLGQGHRASPTHPLPSLNYCPEASSWPGERPGHLPYSVFCPDRTGVG